MQPEPCVMVHVHCLTETGAEHQKALSRTVLCSMLHLTWPLTLLALLTCLSHMMRLFWLARQTSHFILFLSQHGPLSGELPALVTCCE